MLALLTLCIVTNSKNPIIKIIKIVLENLLNKKFKNMRQNIKESKIRMKMYNKCMPLKFDVYSYTHYHLKRNYSFYKLLLNVIKIRKCESLNMLL